MRSLLNGKSKRFRVLGTNIHLCQSDFPRNIFQSVRNIHFLIQTVLIKPTKNQNVPDSFQAIHIMKQARSSTTEDQQKIRTFLDSRVSVSEYQLRHLSDNNPSPSKKSRKKLKKQKRIILIIPSSVMPQ